MNRVDQAVDFLWETGELELGNTPWPDFDEGEEEAFPIDWERLFASEDSPEYEEWAWPVSDRDLADLAERLGRPPQRRQSDEGEAGPWDRCAWYAPIHFYGHRWGIYMREDCIRSLALAISGFLPSSAGTLPKRRLFQQLIRGAAYSLFLHEQYHHKVESFAFRLHVSSGVPAYRAYSKQVYRALVNTPDQLEEALANADSYLRLTQNHYTKAITPLVLKATRAYLRDTFPFEPPGYREAQHYLTASAFQDGQNELLCRVRAANLHHGRKPADWELATGMTRGMFKVTDAISVLVPRGGQVKMPVKYLLPVPTCRPDEMIRLYKSAGYTVRQGRGSHIILEAEGRPSMTIPETHDELSIGVAKNALRVLGDYKIADLPRLVRDGLP
jgi:hypothetical protein